MLRSSISTRRPVYCIVLLSDRVIENRLCNVQIIRLIQYVVLRGRSQILDREWVVLIGGELNGGGTRRLKSSTSDIPLSAALHHVLDCRFPFADTRHCISKPYDSSIESVCCVNRKHVSTSGLIWRSFAVELNRYIMVYR